jgi:hypothetical protein
MAEAKQWDARDDEMEEEEEEELSEAVCTSDSETPEFCS